MLRDEDIGLARVSFHDMTYFTFFSFTLLGGKNLISFFSWWSFESFLETVFSEDWVAEQHNGSSSPDWLMWFRSIGFWSGFRCVFPPFFPSPHDQIQKSFSFLFLQNVIMTAVAESCWGKWNKRFLTHQHIRTIVCNQTSRVWKFKLNSPFQSPPNAKLDQPNVDFLTARADRFLKLCDTRILVTILVLHRTEMMIVFGWILCYKTRRFLPSWSYLIVVP